MGSSRSRKVSISLVSALVVLAASCQWTLPGYDAGKSNYNPGETTLTAANIVGLHEEWSAQDIQTYDSPIVFDGKVYINTWPGFAAYDARGIDGCSGVPRTCTPLWIAPYFRSPFAYGDKIVASGGGGYGTFDPDGVVGCTGSPVECSPLAIAGFNVGRLVPAAGELFGYAGIEGSTSLIEAYDDDVLEGCAYPCAPARTYEAPCTPWNYVCYLSEVTAAGDELVVALDHWNSDDERGVIMGFDRAGVRGCSGVPVTCAPLWTSAVGLGSVALSDGAVVVPTATVDGEDEEYTYRRWLEVLDQATGARRWQSPLEDLGSAGEVAVGGGVVHHRPGNDDEVRTYPLDAGTCTTACPPSHISQLTGSQPVGPVATNGLLFVASTAGIEVFDAAGVAGCSGTPVVCAPLVVATSPGTTSFRSLVVAGGKVWAVGSDNRLHVFGLG